MDYLRGNAKLTPNGRKTDLHKVMSFLWTLMFRLMLSVTYSRLVKLWASFGGVCQARAASARHGRRLRAPVASYCGGLSSLLHDVGLSIWNQQEWKHSCVSHIFALFCCHNWLISLFLLGIQLIYSENGSVRPTCNTLLVTYHLFFSIP